MLSYDVVVIGAGPGGASAAIYAKRNGTKVVVVDSGLIGGQLSLSHEVENYLGIPRMSGQEWSELVKKHLDSIDIPVIIDKVVDIEKTNAGFTLTLASSQKIECYAVVIAIGTEHRHLNVNGENEFFGKGVSYCATCDGYFFRDKTVGVIGGGNTALEYALFLKDIAKKVYLIHRRDEFRAEEVLVKRVMTETGIEKMMNKTVDRFEGNEVLKKIFLKDVRTGEISSIDADGVFIAVGTVPNSIHFKNISVKVDENGFIITNDKQMTNINGIYAAGDVTGKGRAQAIGAAAQGMIAGIEASLYVKQLMKK
ncbi:MAG: NAD(P)/FAD-dependent oxidoreductase [Candidatus Micrarchaeia archaeon]